MNSKKEYINVSIHMKIDGELINLKEVRYERGRETYCFTLDDLAHIVFTWERMFCGTSTHAMEGYLQKAEKELTKKDNETAQSCFEKYWLNDKETIEKEFEQNNNNSSSNIFPVKNDYLRWSISQICRNFNNLPLPVKYGFLYWFHKYVMNSSISEIEADIKQVPDYIKHIVDNEIVNKK